MEKRKCLLHICCAPDATAAFERLQSEYAVIGFFHNSNIFPEAEYVKRRDEAVRVARTMGFELQTGPYEPEDWYTRIRGLEQEPEKGRRCDRCFEHNLDAAARYAAARSISCFTTTLSISPHKLTQRIFEIGRKAAAAHGVSFLEIDFKKKDGFKRSLELSRDQSLYRQNYCGCEYSMKKDAHA